ncbi:MAG: hypothetical protein KCHDKBKB_01351 [Elusimicrobia bacterium]|nr:hypothetical protein [Elusimicrobiota bacterium]
MFQATQGKEIVVKTSNQVGALKYISKTVSEKGVGILAISCWVYDIMAMVHLITDDNLRAKEALQAQKFDAKEEDVVLVEVKHKPGMLKQMTERLEKAGIDLKHLYATALQDAEKCLIVFSSSDNKKALVELNK